MKKTFNLSIHPVAFLAILALLFPLFLQAQPKIQLVNFASGFTLPLAIEQCGDSRIFVVERGGLIWVLDSLGNRLDTFLNIDPRVNSTQNEQGLLGLAFDPNYAQNGYFYVDYTKNGTGDTRVARFSVKPGNPNEADPSSELTILEQAQPYWNHNGGCLKFGPDGFLYISFGDGGSANDPTNNGQNKKTFLGKILRIDVKNSSAAQPYAVPASNPFVGNSDYFPEVWSYGWRNPWRYSFDRLTGDMWIADVGQNLWEEVDFEPANTPGLNYGWRCYEGTHTFNTSGCLASDNYVSPFFDYTHSNANGCSVTGGYIYRGSKFPDLYGCYLFADYCSGRWWYTRHNPDGTFSTNVLANLGGYEFSSFGEDRHGELYVALLASGKIQKVRELCSAFQLSTTSFENTSCKNGFSGLIALNANGGTGNINYTWSNGQTGNTAAYLNPGTYTVEAKDANSCIRRDTFEIVRIGLDDPILTASDTLICPASSVKLTARHLPSPNIINWYNGPNLYTTTTSTDSVVSINVSTPGSYQAVLFDTLCVPASGVVNIGLASVPAATLASNGDTVFTNLSCGNCQWFLNGQPIAGATDSFHVAMVSGLYSLELTTPQGCVVKTGSLNVIISSVSLPASVYRFSLSPNPANQQLMLEMELEKSEHISISLADTSQRQVYAKVLETQKMALPIDLSGLSVGTYVLTVQLESGSIVRKVVKK